MALSLHTDNLWEGPGVRPTIAAGSWAFPRQNLLPRGDYQIWINQRVGGFSTSNPDYTLLLHRKRIVGDAFEVYDWKDLKVTVKLRFEWRTDPSISCIEEVQVDAAGGPALTLKQSPVTSSRVFGRIRSLNGHTKSCEISKIIAVH